MLKFLKRKYKEIKSDDYGKIIVSEIIPIFHDAARTSNKTTYRLDKVISQNKGLFMKGSSTYDKIFRESDFISQDNIPIKVYDDLFNEGVFDLEFIKEGYKVGDIYKFKGLGFLGDLEDICIVKLVTDQYVIFNNGNGITLYSYSELKRLVKI